MKKLLVFLSSLMIASQSSIVLACGPSKDNVKNEGSEIEEQAIPEAIKPEKVYQVKISKEILTVSQTLEITKVEGAQLEVVVEGEDINGLNYELVDFTTAEQPEINFSMDADKLINLPDDYVRVFTFKYNEKVWQVELELVTGKKDINILTNNAGNIKVKNPNFVIDENKAAYILWHANHVYKQGNQEWKAAYPNLNLFPVENVDDYKVVLNDFSFTEMTTSSVRVTAKNSNTFFRKSMVLNFVLILDESLK